MNQKITLEQYKALIAIADAITETIKEAGPSGAPGGVIYAALMTQGCSLQQFETLMSALVHTGRVRKTGHCYFAVSG